MRSLIAASIYLFASIVSARADKDVRIPAGKSADVWWGVNVGGNINYVIRTRDGSDTIKLWWIKWPLGTIDEIGLRSGSGHVKIPIAWWRGVVAAKLRASSDVDCVMRISETSSPDIPSFTFHW